MLSNLTIIVNFVGLIIAVWLGLYIVNRNPLRLISWIACLSLWSVAIEFHYNLLALMPPPPPAHNPTWIKFIFPLWSKYAQTGEANLWLLSWSPSLAFALWHHVTALMRPGISTPWRWIRVILGYILAGIAIFILMFTPFVFEPIVGNPLYINTLQAGPYYFFFGCAMATNLILSLINLIRTAVDEPLLMPRKQYFILITATVVAGVSGLFSLVGSITLLQIPLLLPSFALVITVVLIGYGVANYSALMERRTIRWDMLVNAVSISVIIILYMVFGYGLFVIYEVPAVIVIFVIVFSIVTHSSMDLARGRYDVFFVKQRLGRLRANLRHLSSDIGNLMDSDNYISLALETLCEMVRATFGLIILFEGSHLRVTAPYKWNKTDLKISHEDLKSDDVQMVPIGHFPPPLSDAALLIPLYVDQQQFGALVFGRPVNGVQFTEVDIELLLYPTDQLADTIWNTQQGNRNLHSIFSVLEKTNRSVQKGEGRVSVKMVEDALRNLFDYSKLGDHPLTKLRIIRRRQRSNPVTHLDRGKIVNSVLAETIEKLRPEGKPSSDCPSREWHPYIILHDAYIKNIPNRDILMRLNISEGTFMRTRRAAVRSVTRALVEMDSPAY